MSELSTRYKLATELILLNYDTEPDNLGRSQKWKILAIEEDRKANKDSGILKLFAEEVENMVDKVEFLCPRPAPKKKKQRKIAVKVLKPASSPTIHEPSLPDTSKHGIDLGWD